jgi:DNA-binding NarL/FixJ family response regulator
LITRFKPQVLDPEAAGSLTPREIDVLRLLGRGLRVAEAARVLGITPHTVAGYVKAIYRTLNISSRAEAAIEATKRGLT